MKNYTVTCILMLGIILNTCGKELFAQTYSFRQETQPYQDLQSPDYVIPDTSPYFGNVALTINFDFQAFGTKYDFNTGAKVVTLQGHMFHVNNSRSMTIYFFEVDFTGRKGTGQTSAWSYDVSGNPGNQLLKMEWKNMGFNLGDSADFINFQLWLYERTGKIEIHYGPGSFQAAVFGGKSGPAIGLLEMNPGFSNIYEQMYLTGDPLNPNINYSGYNYLSGTPIDGMVYIFENTLLTGVDDAFRKVDVNIYPTITEKEITIFFPADVSVSARDIQLFDFTGSVILHEKMTFNSHTIDMSALKSGVYLLRITDQNGSLTRRIRKL